MSAKAGQIDERVLEKARIAAPLVVLVCGMAAGLLFGPGIAVLVFAGGVMVAAIASFWTSIRALFGETPLTGEDAFALGAPSAEEEQKRAVLRAIKDLEFEHGVGKISDEDYKELIAKYRAEAKRLLRLIDERASPERARIEKLVAEHLNKQGVGASTPDAGDADGDTRDEAPAPAPEKKKKRASAEASDAPAPVARFGEEDDGDTSDDVLECPSCEVMNDIDAVFCKKCGTRLVEDEDEEDDDEDDDEEEEEEAKA